MCAVHECIYYMYINKHVLQKPPFTDISFYFFNSDQAYKIQRCYMAHYVWIRQLLAAREYFRYLRARFYAARKIQSIIRMQFKGIRVVKKKWEMIYATRELWERKSGFLQRVYRGIYLYIVCKFCPKDLFH